MKEYQFRDNTAAGRYELDLGGGAIAEIDYYDTQDGSRAFTHTGVPSEFENQGVGSQLVKKSLEAAKSSGKKVIPSCGFVAAYVRRHPEWMEIVAERYK